MDVQNCRVTIVCCYNNAEEYAFLKDSISKQSEPAVIVGIDNTGNKHRSCANAYNLSLDEISTKYVIFSHQDIEFTSHDTLKTFADQMEIFCKRGILGVAGAKKEGTQNNVYSNITHGKGSSSCRAGMPITDEFGNETFTPVECETVDECFFGGISAFFKEHPFDEKTCNTWHLYAAERCLYLRANGGKVYTSGVELLHKSQGTVTPDFYECAYRLAEKYAKSFDYITTTCVIISTNPLFIKVFSELQAYIKNNGYLEDENTKLVSMINGLTEQKCELEQQLQAEHRNSLALAQNISSLLPKISGLEKQNQELGQKNQELGQKNQELGQKNQELGQKNQELGQKIQIEQSHSLSLEQNLSSIFNSRSWKLTAPLRNFVAFVKRSKIKRAIFKVVNSYKVYGFKSTLYKILSKCTSVQKQSVNIVERQNQQLSFQQLAAWIQQNGGVLSNDALFRQGDIATGKKVLLISHELNLTGAPIAVGYLAEYFVQRGDFPVLLSPKDGGLRQSLAQQMPVIVDSKAYNGSFVSQLSVAFDLVVVNTTVGGPAIASLNGASVPVMWWIHEAKASYPAEILHAMPETLKDNVHVYCGGIYAQKMLKAHCPSYASEILMYYVPDYVNAVQETRQFRKNANNEKMVFAVVGMQEERKGQDRLVDAIKLLPEEQLKNCLFVFVGKKCYPPIEKKILGVCTMYPDNIEYIEEIPREEMASFYSAMDCLICTSLDDPMPIVVTEAMKFSKLVICSENTGSAAVLEEYQCGFVYRNNDPVELSAKIMEILGAHEENLASMRKNARKAYEELFSSVAFNNAIETVMDEIFPNEVLPPCGKMVSVVIPTYNGAEELSTLIPVLHSQEKVREVEIIVVDSGSQDGSADIAEKLGAKVIRIPKEEFSHSYARNLGASHATGDYLLFMTQDALPNGNRWLAKMLQPILKGDAVAVSCRQIPKSDCDLFGRFAVLSHAQYMGITSKDRILSLPKVQNYETLRLNAQLEDVSCLIIRNIFNKYQYRGNYAEDLDLGLRLIRDNYKLALLSSVQVIHSHSRPPFYHLRRCIVDMKTLKNILPDIPMGHTSTAQTVANRIISAYSVLALFICEALNYIQFSSEQEDFLHWAGVTFRKYEAELARKPKIEVEKLVQTQIPYMDESTTGFVSQITEEYFGHYVFDTLIVAEQRYLLENALPQYFVDTCEEMNSKRKLEICDMLCKHFGQCSGNTMTGLLFSEEDSLLKQLTEKLCIGI